MTKRQAAKFLDNPSTFCPWENLYNLPECLGNKDQIDGGKVTNTGTRECSAVQRKLSGTERLKK